MTRSSGQIAHDRGDYAAGYKAGREAFRDAQEAGHDDLDGEAPEDLREAADLDSQSAHYREGWLDGWGDAWVGLG